MRTTITLNSNTRKNYLENKIQFEAWGHDVDAIIRFQDASSLQLLKQPRLFLNNSLRTVFPVIGHLIELKSFVQFEKQDETLNLEPGMFENIFNNGNPYDAVNQTVLTKRFYTHQSAGFITKWRRFTFFPSAGFVFRLQSLNTHLTTSPDALNPPDTGYFNNNQVFIIRPYLKTGLEYKYKSLVMKAELPVSLHLQQSDDKYHTAFSAESNKLLFEPKGSLHYQFKGFWQAGTTLALIQNQVESDELYYGYMLTHYNRLIRNHLQNALTRGRTFSLRLSYWNPITSLFQSITYANSYLRQPYLLSNKLYPDGRTEVFPVDMPVLIANHSVQYNGSYYLSKLRSSLSLKAFGGTFERQNLLNELVFATRNSQMFINPQLNTQITDWMYAEYGFEQRWLLTKPDQGLKRLNVSSKHLLNFYLYLTGNTNISFTNAYYRFGTGSAFFSDLRFSRKLKPKGMELEIAAQNIFNARTYLDSHTTAYTFYEYTYSLRPVQVIATLRFSL